MRALWVAALLLLTTLPELAARTYHEVTELDAIFDRYGFTGTFVLFDPARDRMEISNRLRAQRRFTELDSGNRVAGDAVDRFWLNGPLTISAIEQTEFLARLVAGKLPVREEAIRAAKETTLLERTGPSELHGKSGRLFNSKRQIGWWAGWVEREGKCYPFALNIDMFTDEDAGKRIPIGRECLKVLGKL